MDGLTNELAPRFDLEKRPRQKPRCHLKHKVAPWKSLCHSRKCHLATMPPISAVTAKVATKVVTHCYARYFKYYIDF
jgi:hypothetical protein